MVTRISEQMFWCMVRSSELTFSQEEQRRPPWWKDRPSIAEVITVNPIKLHEMDPADG